MSQVFNQTSHHNQSRKNRVHSLIQKYESEAALRRVGDHSTFQFFMAFTLMLTIATQGMIIYGLGFL